MGLRQGVVAVDRLNGPVHPVVSTSIGPAVGVPLGVPEPQIRPRFASVLGDEGVAELNIVWPCRKA